MAKYNNKANKCLFEGVQYDSYLEAKCASILSAYGIDFKHHIQFDVFNRQGQPFSYTIDFVLSEPHKFSGIPYLVDVLEVKGVLSLHDIDRLDALEYCHNKSGWIVLAPLLDLWFYDGLFKGKPKKIVYLNKIEKVKK
jgi:hypothetical protein